MGLNIKMKTKVICVSTGGVPELTLHKIYDGFIFQPSHPNTTIQLMIKIK
jgi:hypothetical protein